jgi:hypothetical protein
MLMTQSVKYRGGTGGRPAPQTGPFGGGRSRISAGKDANLLDVSLDRTAILQRVIGIASNPRDRVPHVSTVNLVLTGWGRR